MMEEIAVFKTDTLTGGLPDIVGGGMTTVIDVGIPDIMVGGINDTVVDLEGRWKLCYHCLIAANI